MIIDCILTLAFHIVKFVFWSSALSRRQDETQRIFVNFKSIREQQACLFWNRIVLCH